MKQSKLNKAYPAILRLCDFKLPIKKARYIYTLSDQMRIHFEFALSEEKKCVAECEGTMNNDGTVSFKDKESFEKFQSRMSELNESEIEWSATPIVLSESDILDQLITATDIRDLEGFVSFE